MRSWNSQTTWILIISTITWILSPNTKIPPNSRAKLLACSPNQRQQRINPRSMSATTIERTEHQIVIFVFDSFMSNSKNKNLFLFDKIKFESTTKPYSRTYNGYWNPSKRVEVKNHFGRGFHTGYVHEYNCIPSSVDMSNLRLISIGRFNQTRFLFGSMVSGSGEYVAMNYPFDSFRNEFVQLKSNSNILLSFGYLNSTVINVSTSFAHFK